MSATKAGVDAFRAVAKARHSCRRFQPGKPLAPAVLKDIIETSLVCISALVSLNLYHEYILIFCPDVAIRIQPSTDKCYSSSKSKDKRKTR